MKKDSNKPVVQDLEARLTQLDLQLENLRTLYEQYFAGILKRVPLKEHDQLKQAFKMIPTHELKTTATKFRFQSLKTRHLNLSNFWNRTLKEIEEGHYRRELNKLKAKEKTETPLTKSRESTPAPSKEGQYDLLYKKFSEVAGQQNQKVPSKESFIKALQTQIDAQKAKSPGARFEVKLQKDESGKYQIKLKVNR